MSRKYNFNIPINNLSLGQVGYNFLNQAVKSNIEFDYLPYSNQLDFSTFSSKNNETVKTLIDKANSFHSVYSRKNPTFSLWHINGSENNIGDSNHLLTFHETDVLTSSEVNILNNQEQVFVTSAFTKDVFESSGVKVPVHFVNLGYDTDHFYRTNKKYLEDSITVFLINGKIESRKKTREVIQLWLKKYGNNPAYRLHLQVYNPHLTSEQNLAVVAQIFGGKEYFNVSLIPYLDTLDKLNESYNAADIIINGSGAEGWSLPDFHCVGLGKHALVHYTTGIKSWAHAGNSTLVSPTGKTPCYDGIFFQEGAKFNQGNFFKWDESDFSLKLDEVLQRKINKKENTEGLNLPIEFTWKKCLDSILEKIS